MNALKLAMSFGLVAIVILCGLKAKAQEASTMQLKQGDTAPGFELKAQDGKMVRNSDFKGRKLLLYFYPRAETPGCTAQACSIRDAMPDLGKLSVAAVGISPDLPEAQASFAVGHSLPFPLLSDPDHKVAEAYGVWAMKKIGAETKMGILRSSFLIDETGKIAGAWYNVKPEDTVPKALEVLNVKSANTSAPKAP